MMKRTELILLFMLVLSGAVLLGTMPAGAQDTTLITGVCVDNGKFVTSLSGQTPIDPCYNPNPIDCTSPCYPMVQATEFWICDGTDGPPTNPPDLNKCRKFNYSTLGFAYNRWVNFGGRYIWVPCPTCPGG